MTQPFLPPEYEVPKTGGSYTKFVAGDNKFRLLSAPVMGFEYWTNEGKPVRLHDYPENRPANMRQGQNESIKHFWALKVWNYRTKALEVLEITQSTIQTGIQTLAENADWGDPRDYDITINKSGSGKESTKYAIMPSPKKAADASILEALASDENSLDDLFESDDDDAGDLGEVGVPLADKVNARDFKPDVVKRDEGEVTAAEVGA